MDGRRPARLERAAVRRAGRPRGCIGAFIDITDRKRTEQALRERKGPPAPGPGCRAHGNVELGHRRGPSEWNDEMYRQLGYRRVR
jgi:hypothetical protein